MSKAAQRRERRDRQAAMVRELSELRAGLDGAYSVFNHTADQEMVEASILEIGALQSKYSCLLRSLKSFML